MPDDPKRRYPLLDSIRGLTLISMIAYHAVWDMVYIFGVHMPWYQTRAAFLWQQSICWTFILLSGFCFPFGRKKLRRGLTVLAASLLISAVTILFTPESAIRFGVLSLIGSAMLVMIPLEEPLGRILPAAGAAASFFLFLATRWVNRGYLGFGSLTVPLPESWYANLFTAWLGFPAAEFASSDYFSLLPWLFLYVTGFFLCRQFLRKGWPERLPALRCPPLEWLGRRSLLIYLLHQPVIYGILTVIL